MDLSREEKIRTFIAVGLPHEVKDKVRSVVQGFHEVGARVVWTRLENLHLTLKFLGNTSLEQLDTLKSSLQEVAEESSPFEMTLKGLGGFPNEKKPRIVWMGVEKGELELKTLFQLLELSVARLGFKEEKNPFVPHLTLGRIKFPKTNKRLEEKILDEKESVFGCFNVSSFKLFQSSLTREGPLYKVLHDFKI